MKSFNYYLNKVGEIGYVEGVLGAVAYVRGLPHAKPSEVIMFESGSLGYVLSLNMKQVEVLFFSEANIRVGMKVTRCDKLLEISLTSDLLGKTVDSLAREIDPGQSSSNEKDYQSRLIDVLPEEIIKRKGINQPFETGVGLVDLVVPLAKGQRELVVGDGNSGKTFFLLQVLLNQAKDNTICVYAAIGKKRVAIKRLSEFFESHGIKKNIVFVISSASELTSMIFLTPYTAMTIAEYFKDKGRDVLLILDDMTNHAKYYREIALLAKRFPGRDSYPGDIFYVHSRLLERAGNFSQGSITCLPVAESVMGDLSGYIQTNLMAMTDGHLYFDTDLVNMGKFPAVNPFLSITRVGMQTQSELLRDINLVLVSFLVKLEKARQYMHFGAELGEEVKKTLHLGEKIDTFFKQEPDVAIPVKVNAFLLAALWGGFWREDSAEAMKIKMGEIINFYKKDEAFRKKVDQLVASSKIFSELINNIRLNDQLILGRAQKQNIS